MKKNTDSVRRRFIKKGLVAGAGLMIPFINRAGTLGNEEEKNADPMHSAGAVILFQGDSITDGNRIKNNTWDQNHQMGHGYAFAIAAELGYQQPEKKYSFFNRGISGNKLSDLVARWEQDTIAIKPGVLSILIGVNDADAMINANANVDATVSQFDINYRALLKDTRSRLPSCSFIMLEPFILPVGRVKENWQVWNNVMQQLQNVSKEIAKESNTLYIPLQKAFEKAATKALAEYWIWDGIHPTPAGHELIAREWIKLVNL
jgi:lysophospholipase L1-like esterase